ncbi:MAG: MBOAT family protein [Anaerolineae bacterium]
MNFASLVFLQFISVVMLLLFVFKNDSVRKVILLVASYIFYGYWDYRFTALIFFSTIVDFFIGRALGQSEENELNENQRKWLLILSMCVNLGLLGFFKYFNFFIDSANVVLSSGGWNVSNLNIILPVGISFYTFQTMSYTIDIYRRRLAPAKSFLDFATFVAFFPQLVAGPIVRAIDFMPQLERGVVLDKDEIFAGIQIFIRGLFIKLVIADNLSLVVDQVYGAPDIYSSATVWLAAVAYSFQILCDFSGYSEMAIGLGRMMGLTLPQNFNLPYTSISITEFWRRWHISLSTWLRDYLYIPLGGNRKGVRRTYINLMLTMLLGGLWHGASWNFVIWGFLHGLYLAVERLFDLGNFTKSGETWRSPKVWLQACTVFIIVTLTWVFFRSPSFDVTLLVFNKLLFLDSFGIQWFYRPALLVIPTAFIGSFVVRRFDIKYPILNIQQAYAPAVLFLQLATVFFLAPTNASPFIYFQF